MLTEVRGIGAVSSINIDGIMFRICSCHVYSGQVRQAVTQTIFVVLRHPPSEHVCHILSPPAGHPTSRHVIANGLSLVTARN